MQRARLVQALSKLPAACWERLSLATGRKTRPGRPLEQAVPLVRQRVQDWGWNAVIVVASVELLYLLATFIFGHSLGIRSGRLLGPNVNLNDRFDPEVTQQFRALSVQVGADQTVWLSSVCSASQDGRQVPAKLATAVEETGVLPARTLSPRWPPPARFHWLSFRAPWGSAC